MSRFHDVSMPTWIRSTEARCYEGPGVNDAPSNNGSRVKKPGGAPKGNTSSFQHGAYSLLAMRTKGRPNGNTKLGCAFRAREKEYLRDISGDEKTLSLAQHQLANDNVWCDFILSTVEYQLSGKRQLTRKGRPHR